MPLYIGLMSGTSMDGVDGVLTSFSDAGARSPLLASAYIPFPPSLRTELMALQASADNEIEREALAANDLAQLYAACVAQLLSDAKMTSGAVQAIGVHGQTIRHRPDLGYTRQANNPALLAELTGIDVVADFRSRDMAAGGQGAPLVPAFHQAVFGEPGKTRVLINIGGISNISILHGDGAIAGFDIGPGNALLDAWIQQHRGQDYDAEGLWAAQGSVIPELLARMLQEPFFFMPPPKSSGRDLFNLGWLTQHLQQHAGHDAYRPEDVQTTLTILTAQTIADAVARNAPQAEAIYICGGGAYNAHLMRRIMQALSRQGVVAPVLKTDTFGISPSHVEALAFAWLAYRFCQREAASLPSVTGARGPRILGALYPA